MALVIVPVLAVKRLTAREALGTHVPVAIRFTVGRSIVAQQIAVSCIVPAAVDNSPDRAPLQPARKSIRAANDL
jgi:hypothetical protein